LIFQARNDISEALGFVLEVFQRSFALLHHTLQLVVELFLHLGLFGHGSFFERFKLFHGTIFFGLMLSAVPARHQRAIKLKRGEKVTYRERLDSSLLPS
jgi:hypothetical protein